MLRIELIICLKYGLIFFILAINPGISLAEFCRTYNDGSKEQVATRVTTYKTVLGNGKKVKIIYVGTTHEGASSYFARLKEILSDSELILAEGVLPAGFYGPPYINDSDFSSMAQRLFLTQVRINTIREKLALFKEKNGRNPRDLSELYIFGGRKTPIFDAWGSEFIYSDGQVISLGSDKAPSGTGFARDLNFDDGLSLQYFSIFQDLQKIKEANRREDLEEQPSDIEGDVPVISADVSVDMLDVNDFFKINKNLVLRDHLPRLLLYEQLSKENGPTKIGIHYGCGHGESIDEGIKHVLFALGADEQIEISEEWVLSR